MTLEYYKEKANLFAEMLVSCKATSDDLEVPFQGLNESAEAAESFLEFEKAKL